VHLEKPAVKNAIKKAKEEDVIVKLTQQGYEIWKRKNAGKKSLSVTEIKRNLSSDFPNYEIFYSNECDKIESHLRSLISKETSPMYFFFFLLSFPFLSFFIS